MRPDLETSKHPVSWYMIYDLWRSIFGKLMGTKHRTKGNSDSIEGGDKGK